MQLGSPRRCSAYWSLQQSFQRRSVSSLSNKECQGLVESVANTWVTQKKHAGIYFSALDIWRIEDWQAIKLLRCKVLTYWGQNSQKNSNSWPAMSSPCPFPGLLEDSENKIAKPDLIPWSCPQVFSSSTTSFPSNWWPCASLKTLVTLDQLYTPYSSAPLWGILQPQPANEAP